MTGQATYDFELDPFQIEAIAALEQGRSVLVAAPTGSGKTVVAERAIEIALEDDGKAFYTTPIKALSNQKYHDLVGRHGRERVGLLTGDNTINGDAPIVVMTTEVLRNMIYARSGALDRLRFVVLDEVHYLQDAYRGPVWEEVIIHLPVEVRLVCLSATVSNAAELTEWITTVRGPTAAVVEEKRPVELENLFAVDDRESGDVVVVPTLRDGQANPAGRRFDVDPRLGWRSRTRRRYATPNRVEVVDLLRERSLLPAIAFIFSRAACDDAVTACVNAGIRLTSPAERTRLRELADHHLAGLGDDDLAVLGHAQWLVALEAGVAAHHAGLVPPFKEAVEACFSEGLVKVVFATETLALGINMPARSVVIEKLTKFTGERHEFLTPGQYTQLTGRAGRRGIDDSGTAVVLWSPFVPFDEVATLASSRTFRLTSSFRPTYNMAVNLVRRYPADRAHQLLNLSFAQFQADHAVVRLEARLAKRKQYLSDLRETARCDLGDVEAYAALVEAQRRQPSTGPSANAVDVALRAIKPGDVLRIRGGKSGGKVAVLSVSQRKGGAVRLRAITPGRRVVSLGAADFDEPPRVLATVALPRPFAPQNAGFQKAVSRELTRVELDTDIVPDGSPGDDGGPSVVDGIADHPVDRCPDRDDHLRALRQAARVGREVDDLGRQIRGHTESLARTFDRVLQLLETWGFLDGWSLTRKGEVLGRVFHECDLVVAECLDAGVFDGLQPDELAALLSVFTYEHRSSTPPVEPWFPNATLQHRLRQVEQVVGDLNADERRLGLSLTRGPDPGFIASAYAWAAGQGLDDVLGDDELSAGDFVRNIKQLLDLIRQVGDTAESPDTARSAREAAERLFRGVVAASTAIAPDEPPSGTAP